MALQIAPAITLSDVFGRDVVFSSRVPPNACKWLSFDNPTLDLMAGTLLAMSGATPYLCARTVSTKEALKLLSDASLQVPNELFQYQGAEDYLHGLDFLCRQGKTFAMQHVHLTTDVASENCLIPPSILSFLNNKANYREIVDNTYLQHRTIHSSGLIFEKLSSLWLPVVIKASTDETSGGGFDVFICRSEHDLKEAEKKFQACSRVVVEEYLEIHRNLCLNYAVTANGKIIYIGSAEQVSDAEGKYQGNWIDPQSEAPPEAVKLGHDIVQRSFEYGYWGFVGLDMAVQDDGYIIVFDLNFRVCGSTCALALAEAVRKNLGQPVIRSRNLVGKGTYGKMLDNTYKAMERKLMIPIASYDPAAGGYSTMPIIRGLIMGKTREEVEENQRQIAEWGFSL
jgi:hypothetical protein